MSQQLFVNPFGQDPAGSSSARRIGWWKPGEGGAFSDDVRLAEAILHLRRPLFVLEEGSRLSFATDGSGFLGEGWREGLPLVGYVAPQELERLGDISFCIDHRLRYPYYAGAMANGIGSVEIVEALGRAGMLGFFGAAGLAPGVVEAAIDRLTRSLGSEIPWGFNLIHSPNERDLEEAVVDLYLRRGVKLVEASAYLDLTPAVVRYRVSGLHRNAAGAVVAPNQIIAKVSRVEVAAKFFAPPPEGILRELVSRGLVTEEEARLAVSIPMADDVTAEADSAGHTDNRPAITLLPTIRAVADRAEEKYGYAKKLRVGLAGGIATPASAAAAFAMGAAFIVTGSVNQACVESGSSDEVRQMLAETEQADVAMAPAADMFEMGVTVQVLKRGTMFPMRAARLYELYRAHDSIEAIPAEERSKIEKTIFRQTLADTWRQTREFFTVRDPREIERAERDPKHKMALVFRWYLGQSSRWANRGESARRVDYQIWCGPAMGAFNEWTKGSHLEQAANRRVVDVGLNILYGAAVQTRVQQLRAAGATVPSSLQPLVPRDPAVIKEHLR